MVQFDVLVAKILGIRLITGVMDMETLVLIVVIIFFLGPLRRPFCRHGRFTIPFTVGLFIGFGVGGLLAQAAGLPPELAALVGLVMGISLGSSLGQGFKNWCDGVFGKKEQDRD